MIYEQLFCVQTIPLLFLFFYIYFCSQIHTIYQSRILYTRIFSLLFSGVFCLFVSFLRTNVYKRVDKSSTYSDVSKKQEQQHIIPPFSSSSAFLLLVLQLILLTLQSFSAFKKRVSMCFFRGMCIHRSQEFPSPSYCT